MEQGRSFGGAYVNDLSGGDKLYQAVADALHSVPGRHGYHLQSDKFRPAVSATRPSPRAWTPG